MTDEQKAARKKSAESGNIKWIKDHCLRTAKEKEDYVFISYKSDDYEKVLDDIVYNACRKYGLRVYFDTAFDDDSDSWIKQFYKNMCSPHCKAFIAFLDNKYYSSYATLIEMMARKTEAAGGDYKKDSLFFLPINLEPIEEILCDDNTGLGTRRYANGRINKNAAIELQKFNEIFAEIATDEMRRGTYKREKDTVLYDEETPDQIENGEVYLTVTQCRALMYKVIPDSNENDGTNKDYVEVIHDKLVKAKLGSVFGTVSDEPLPEPPIPKPDNPTKLPVSQSGKITFLDFVKTYNPRTFNKNTFTKLRLVGTGEYAKYSTDFCDSTYSLVWSFVDRILRERGKEYIDFVNSKNAGSKNPPFITTEEHKIRDDRGDSVKYRKLEIPGLTGYSMCRHFGQYDWIASVLKKRMQELGLPLEKFLIEYTVGDELVVIYEAPEKNDDAEQNKEESKPSVETISGRFSLPEFLKKYNNNTFQSKSCKKISLIGVNGYERCSIPECETARQLVFTFAMRRLDEQGMNYINCINSSFDSKNPIFITTEEHKSRKERHESVTYKAVTSQAVSGYSMCTHYSEYGWLNISLTKQLEALQWPMDNFYLELES